MNSPILKATLDKVPKERQEDVLQAVYNRMILHFRPPSKNLWKKPEGQQTNTPHSPVKKLTKEEFKNMPLKERALMTAEAMAEALRNPENHKR